MIEAIERGARPPRARGVCDQCQADEVVPCGYSKGANPEPDAGQVKAKLQGMGWALVKGKLLCPACAKKRRAGKAEEPDAGAPTPAQRREILDYIAAVYDISAERYQGAESDATVATAVGLPEKWVAELRESFFGPAGGNEALEALTLEVEGFLKSACACRRSVEAQLAVIEEEISAAQKLRTRILAQAAELNGRGAA